MTKLSIYFSIYYRNITPTDSFKNIDVLSGSEQLQNKKRFPDIQF